MQARSTLVRSTLVAVPMLAAALLSACVVVPVDPRTGAPYSVAVPAAAVAAPAPVVPAVAPAPVPQMLQARLYPLNPEAASGGTLTAQIVDGHGGRGTISVGYRGDVLQGESTRVGASYPAFGQLHAQVLGSAPQSGYGGQRGVANAQGRQGIGARCEYLITGPAQGTGVCLFSDGAKYQLHFGG